MIYLPPYDTDSVGGPATFMRNLRRFLSGEGYKVIDEPYLATGMFFPIYAQFEHLDFIKRIGGAIIQRLDGVYYPSQHGAGYKLMNSDIERIYNDYATMIVFQSDYSRRQCFEMIGEIPVGRYQIIHNGVNLDIFIQRRTPNDIPGIPIRGDR